MEFEAQRKLQLEEENERQTEINRLIQEQKEACIAIKRKEHKDMLEEKRVLKKQKHTSFCISLIDSMIDISLTIQMLNVKTQNQARG